MKKQDLLIILIPTLICVIAWISFNVYHSAVTSTISSQEISQIIPINPSFNTKTIAELKKRERVEPVFQATPSSLLLIPIPTPTILHVPITISSKSAQATIGGQINK